jgi:photosystem II stability/assembly factor-like uncharacterized protein
MRETDIARLLDRAGRSYRPDTAQGLTIVRARTERVGRRSHRLGVTGIAILAVATTAVIGLVLVSQRTSPARAPYLRIPSSMAAVALTTPTNGLADVSFADAAHGIGMEQDCSLSATADTTCSLTIVTTSDGGRTWAPVGRALHVTYPDSRESYPFINFATNGKDGWIFGSKTFVTHDGGRTFTDDGQRGLVMDLSIVGDETWALARPCPPAVSGCLSTVYSTPTGGGPWHEVRGAPGLAYPYLQLLRPSANDAWLAAQATDGTLYVTDDGGVSWASHALPEPCTQLLHLAAVTGNEGWALCSGPAPSDAQTKELYRTVDAGRTWRLVAASSPGAIAGVGTLPASGIVTLFTSASRHRLWIALDTGPLLASIDGGRTWTRQGFPASGAVNQLTFTDAGHGWALVSPDETLYRTSDGGGHWLRVAR